MRQMELFRPKPVERKSYAMLGLHEKINYKANCCGLHPIYLSRYNYFRNYSLLIGIVQEYLTGTYRWHHKVNAGHENRINNRNKQGKLI